MRVDKTDVIAGLPAPLARSVIRKFVGRERVQEIAEDLLQGSGHTPAEVVSALEAGGYLEKIRTDEDGDIWWETTIEGNSFAMASFGKPIRRKTADRLVAGLLERARSYNADPGKPMFIDRLRLFGSYLDPGVDPLGDVDVELVYGRRITDAKAVREYTRASGRNFDWYFDELMWPRRELIMHLRNRSAALNITLEDIDLLTERSRILYSIDEDQDAAPPPADRQLVAGRAGLG